MTSVRTALVTGAAGFIGSHVCDRLLADGWRVVGIDDLSTGRPQNLSDARTAGERFAFEEVDIRTTALSKVFERTRPEVVMHLAAQSGVRPSVEDPEHDAAVNVVGLLNVLGCAARAGTRKVVFASSGGTIYGEPDRFPVSEPMRHGSVPVSPYGISKQVAEHYLRFFQRYRGLDFTILALANVYGPRQDAKGEAGVVAIFARTLLAGDAPTINGDGEQTRDYVYVEDVADAFARAIEHGSGELFNIGTGIETSVNDVFRALVRITGVPVEPVTGPLPDGDLRRSALDAGAAEQVLGWKPQTQLEEGLEGTISSIRGQGA